MPAAAIAPVGLTAGEVMPGLFIETNFAQGPAVGSGVIRGVLVMANKTASGIATPDTVIYGPDTPVPLSSDAHMITLGGTGSEAHRMFRRIADITGGKSGPPIYWLFVTESVGAKATGTITIATNATGLATLRIYLGDEFVDTPINSGDTPTVIATAAAANINAKTHWAATAGNSSGVITLTSRQNGLRGNWLRYQSQILANGSVGTTTTATTDTFFTGGTTADSNTTALTTINGKFFYYIIPAAEDVAQTSALISQVNTQALAINGNRQRVVIGSIDTPANAISIAVANNAARGEMVHSEKSPFTPAEIAAHNGIIYALEEASELGFRTNFIGYGTSEKTKPLWKIPRSRVDSAAPSVPTLRSLLTNGISPVAVTQTGSTYLVDRFTMRSLNGALPETRIRDAHKVTITDRFADALGARLRVAGEGKAIADDPPNNQAPVVGTVTPRICKMVVYQTIDEFVANAKLQSGVDPNTGVDRVQQQRDGSVIQRESNPTSRMGIKVPIQTSDNARQFAVIVDQVA